MDSDHGCLCHIYVVNILCWFKTLLHLTFTPFFSTAHQKDINKIVDGFGAMTTSINGKLHSQTYKFRLEFNFIIKKTKKQTNNNKSEFI